MEWKILGSLSPEEQRAVLRETRRRRFRRGEVIFHEGDPGDTLHLVAKGHVAIRRFTPRGDVTTLLILGAGDFFGELVLVSPDAGRNATVVALDPTDTLALHRDRLEVLRREHPSIDRFLLDAMAKEIRRLSSAEVWNGRTWTLQATPDPLGGRASVLWAVSCPASRTCEAVGEYTGRAGTEVPVPEGWNGATWTAQTTPHDFGGGPSLLESVSCVTSHSCEAVGQRTDGAGVETTLAEGWNGSTWQEETTPTLHGSVASLLESVSCPTSNGCVAVGASTNRYQVGRTLAEERIDGAWLVLATPTPS